MWSIRETAAYESFNQESFKGNFLEFGTLLLLLKVQSKVHVFLVFFFCWVGGGGACNCFFSFSWSSTRISSGQCPVLRLGLLILFHLSLFLSNTCMYVWQFANLN